MNKKQLHIAIATIISTLTIVAGLVGVKLSHADNKSQKKASSPTDLSLSTWKSALLETKNAFSNKSLPILAAGVAYFSTIAFFPLLAAAVAIAAFVIDQDQIRDVAAAIGTYLPNDIASLITAQLQTLTGQGSNNLLIAAGAILLSLFSVSGATQNLISATNTAYGRAESRGFLKLRLTSLVLTVGTVLSGFIILPLLIISESTLLNLGVPEVVAGIFPYLRWILLVILVTVMLAVFYRIGPDREDPPWQWVSWGAAIATVIWLLATVLFFIYAQYFAGFSDSYSLYAGIIVLMMWLNVTALIVLVGAEINHRLEKKATAANISD